MTFNLRFLNWYQEKWKLYISSIPLDGNCFIHCLCQALISDYRDLVSEIDKYNFVVSLRKQLSLNLTYETYSSLLSGNLRLFGEQDDKYSYINIKSSLDSSEFIRHGQMSYICQILKLNLYLLHLEKKQVYKSEEIISIRRDNLPCVILLYSDKSLHFELVIMKLKSGQYQLYFNRQDEIIQYLEVCEKL